MSAHIKNTVIEDVTKKDICRYYILGRCIMGSQCKFRHELDFEFMKKTLKFCHDFQNSTGCLRQHCTFLHATKEEQILFITTGQLPKVLAERHAMMSAATAERHAMMSAATAETIPQIALYIQESSASTAAPPPPPPPPLPAATASAPQPRSAPSQPAFTSGYRRPSVGSVAPMVPQWTPLAARHTSMMPMQQLPRPPPQPTSTITSVRQHAPVFTGPTPGPTFGMVQPPPLIPMYDASKPPPPIMPMRVQPTNGPSKRQSSNEDGNACPSKLRKGDEAIADCEQWLQKEQRDQSAQAARARNRHNSLARTQNNVIALHWRFNRYAIDDESLMIATVVFMRESIAKFSERTLDIDQLFPLRHRLRAHVWQLMNGEYAAGSEEQLCDAILERQSEFINRIGTITPLPSDVDLVASLRAVLTHFLNEAALLINVNNHYIVFARRFRTLFSQMFYEICGVISNCCQDGVEGLRKIYRAFMIDLIKNIDEPAREQLLSLAMDNLETAVRRMKIWSSNYLQYVRRIPSACKIEKQESAASASVKTEVTEDDVDVTIKKETEEPCASSEPSVRCAAPVVDSAPMPAPIATSSPQQTPGQEILHTDSGGQSSQSTSAASTSVGPVDGFLSARTGQNRRIAQSRGRQRHSRQLNSNSTTTDSSNEAGFSVREVATPLTAVSDEWRALFREELTREARRRVARSADYEPDRFTATARFLAQTSNPPDTEEMASQMSCRK